MLLMENQQPIGWCTLYRWRNSDSKNITETGKSKVLITFDERIK